MKMFISYASCFFLRHIVSIQKQQKCSFRNDLLLLLLLLLVARFYGEMVVLCIETMTPI